MEKKITLIIAHHFPNGWYGTNRKFILDLGFKTKREAHSHTSMLHKYLKESYRTTCKGIVEVGDPVDIETYRYCGAGPSYSCEKIFIKTDAYLRFRENYAIDMKERRESREFYASCNAERRRRRR